MQFQVSNYAPAIADFKATDTCLGEKTIFTNLAQKGAGSFGYDFIRWETENQTIIDTSENVALQYQRPGIYNVAMFVRGKNSCITNRIEKKVIIVGNPEFVVESSDSCTGKLMVTVNNINSDANIKKHFWEIDYGDGSRKKLLDSLMKTDSYTYTNPGNYQVKVSSRGALSCQTQTLTKIFTNVAVAKANFNVGDTCWGMPSLFKNTSVRGFGNTGYSFAKWYINNDVIEDTSSSINYTYQTPGTYRVSLHVQGNNSCVVDSISKQLVVTGYPTANFVYKDSCAGFDVLFTDISATSPNDKIAQWQWNFADKGTPLFTPNPIRSFKREGSYAVNLLVQSKTCPQFYHDTTINVTIIRPRRNLRYNTIYTVKDMQNKLDAYPSGRSYEWIPNLYLNNFRVKQPLINPDFVEKEYQVRIVDSSGCINVDTLMVWGFDKPDIYLPTAFSPNNDGYNDVYKAEYVMIEHLEYLKVLDKFNNIIFETKSMSESWDGVYKGRPVAADAYLVLVSAVDKRKQRIQKKVTVNLLR